MVSLHQILRLACPSRWEWILLATTIHLPGQVCLRPDVPVILTGSCRTSQGSEQTPRILSIQTGQPKSSAVPGTPAHGLHQATTDLEDFMKIGQVRYIAKSHSIKPDHLSKLELIRAIQSEEGNFDCFATAYDGYCDQLNCLWRDDCFATSQKGELS